MTDDLVDPLARTTRVLTDLAARLVDALPAVARIMVDVERDWVDQRRHEWSERVALVERVLTRELDAVLANARAVGEALRTGGAPDGPEPRPVGPGTVARSGRADGPRLGGTEAERVDDERGVRIARLGDTDGEPG